MDGMEFQILGQLEVTEDGRRLTPHRAKQQALLALLLLRANQTVSVDDLLDALWGEEPPGTARTALHGHVSSLRKLLGATRIVTERSGYVLKLKAGELDSERFEGMVAEAGRTPDPITRARLLREALALWRGEALTGFKYFSVAEASIARLEGLRLSALEHRVDADLELGRHAELVPELEQLLAIEPLRERLRWQLMLALYRSGRQADALHAYEAGRRALSEEFGLDPGPTLQRLQEQILKRDPELDPAGKPAPVYTQARKVVTVLVAELAPSKTIDPEDLERLIDAPLKRCRSLLERFGATVEPLFANAVVALFGASRAHEDDPERAVRAAIALREEVSREAGFELRVGVESGVALVTVGGARVDVAGAVLSSASRLQAAAPAGGILVGERVHGSTSEAIDYESSGTSFVVRAARRPIRAVEAEPDDIPFVGREQELAMLDGCFARTLEGNVAQLVTIAGEPGSGKSRLAREFRASLTARGPHTWREGRCLPYGDGITFWALGEILKAQSGILESDSPEASTQKLRSAVGELFGESGDRAWVEAGLAPLVGISVEATPSQEHLVTAWRRFLEAIAAQKPLVMLIEDIHWADPALIELIEGIVEELGSLPLLTICTTRLEFFDHHPGWGGGMGNVNSIVLPPLDEIGTRALFQAILGRAPSLDLVRRAGGNPLFAQELARMVVASPRTEALIPETIHAVIAARLDTLRPEVKETATHAAVVGEVFWSGAVAAIGGINQREAEDRLRQLVKGQFVRRARTSSVKGQVEYAFVHALVRDVAYGVTSMRRRADLHQAAATWIEELAGDRASDHAEFVAYHYGAALDLLRSAGKQSEELEVKTSRFLVLAGDRAMRLDIGAAERLYHRALELNGEEDPHRASVIVRLAGAAQEAGRLREAAALYDDAIAAFQGRGDWLAASRALMDLSRALWRIGDTARHRVAIDEAIGLLEPHGLGPDLVRAWMLKGRDLEHAGQAEESLPWSERALQAADQVGRPDLKVWSMEYRGVARKHLGDQRAKQDMLGALRLGLELGLGIETAICYSNLGNAVSEDEGPEEALRVYREGMEFSERRGLLHNVMWIRSSLPSLYFQLGEWDRALTEGNEVLAWDHEHGVSQISMTALHVKVEILVGRGSTEEATAAAAQLLPMVRRIGEAQAIVLAIPAVALSELSRGNLAAALDLVREIEVATRDLPGWRGERVADCVRICVAAGDLGLSETLIDGADTNLKLRLGSVLSAKAALAEALGDFSTALARYRDALEVWTAFGHRPEQGYALLGQGRCLVALGRLAEGQVAMGGGRLVFSELGAFSLLDALALARD